MFHNLHEHRCLCPQRISYSYWVCMSICACCPYNTLVLTFSRKPSSIELLLYHGTLVHLPIHLLLHTSPKRYTYVVPASIRKCLHYLSRLLGGLGFLARQHNLGHSVARDIDNYSVWVYTPVSSACRCEFCDSEGLTCVSQCLLLYPSRQKSSRVVSSTQTEGELPSSKRRGGDGELAEW
jgi:hypothetical protein